MRLRYKIRDSENASLNLFAYFEKYPKTPVRNMNIALKYLRKKMKLDSYKKIKKYRNWLTWMAINQPANGQYSETLGLILNEKKRVNRTSKCEKM